MSVSIAVLHLASVRLPLQVLGLTLLALVAGGTFTIWRGYNPAAWTPEAFVQVHQTAVRGLNALLPGIAIGSALAALTLCLGAVDRGTVALYLGALVLIVAGGAVTRLGNQPINALVMGWTAQAVPADWSALRDRWWQWHVLRTALSVAAFVTLATAVQRDLWQMASAARS